jgi:hypothetical protein
MEKIFHRDLVELVPNDTFKDKLYEVIMLSKDKIMIDVSTKSVHITAIISPDLVAKVHSREQHDEVSAEYDAVEMVLKKHLFNEFEG